MSEGLVLGVDEYLLQIDVSTLRVSEREHRILYQVFSSNAANVVSFGFMIMMLVLVIFKLIL